jgi:hypothetical protein
MLHIGDNDVGICTPLDSANHLLDLGNILKVISAAFLVHPSCLTWPLGLPRARRVWDRSDEAVSYLEPDVALACSSSTKGFKGSGPDSLH